MSEAHFLLVFIDRPSLEGQNLGHHPQNVEQTRAGKDEGRVVASESKPSRMSEHGRRVRPIVFKRRNIHKKYLSPLDQAEFRSRTLEVCCLELWWNNVWPSQ